MANQRTSSVNPQNLSQEELVQKWLPLLRTLFIVLGVGVLAGLGWLVWKNIKETQAEKAFSALAAADIIEERALKEFQDRTNQDFLKIVTQWPESKKQEYIESLERVLKEFHDESAVASAGLRLAAFYGALKDFPKAEKSYRDLLGKLSKKRTLLFKALAYEGLAVSLEAQGKNEEALSTYNEFTQMKDNPLKPLALMGQARIQEVLGKKEEAVKVYDEIIKDFAGTSYERQARVLQSFIKTGQSS